MSGLGDWAAVETFAAARPGASAGTYYGGPAVMAAASDRPVVTPSREPDSFVLHIDADQKSMLMDLDPALFWETPHYQGYPALLVRYGPADGIAEWIDRALELAAAKPRRRKK
ncbi:hypothetical protein GCM10022280_08630 [Sphingomonas swuensis]|uniref:MmcQ/YjbR family DNA-binding protein n=1 Tax=Sphingomonas swuensis TaxID=977800 RepID=A0ABP7SKP9_9SPHN